MLDRSRREFFHRLDSRGSLIYMYIGCIKKSDTFTKLQSIKPKNRLVKNIDIIDVKLLIISAIISN